MIDVSIISKIVSRKTEGEKIGKTPSAPGSFLDKSIWDSIFELKADSVGNKYLFGKLPLVTQYGITMFANGGNVDIPSIAQGLPYDNKTIWYNPSTNQIEVIGGTGGGSGEGVSNFWDLSDIPSWITNSKPKYTYSEIEGTPDLSGYATQSWVNTRIDSLINGAPAAYDTLKEIADVLQGNVNSIGDIITALGTKWTQDNTKIANWDTAYSWGNHANAGYALKSYVDDTFVTLGSKQTITGEKNFIGGIKVNGSPIYYDSTNKYWKLEGDLLVTGGVTMYGNDSEFTPSTIMDAIQTDGVTIRVNPTTKNLEVIGNTSGATTLGGLSNVGTWADSVADVDRIMYQAAGSSNWVAKSLSSIGGGVSGDYLPLSGGELKGSLSIGNNSTTNQLLLSITRNKEKLSLLISGAKEGWLSTSYEDGKSTALIQSESAGLMYKDTSNTYSYVLHSNNYSQYALPISGGTMVAGSAIRWDAQNGKKGYIGHYSTDGSFLISIEGNDTMNGLVLGGTSGNLLYKGAIVLNEINFSSYALSSTGGTLTVSSKDDFIIKVNVNGGFSGITYSNSNEGALGYMGVGGAYSSYPYQPMFVTRGGETYQIWHSNNDGSGSGLDADLLDGVQESGFCRHLDGIPITSHRGIGYGYSDSGWILNGPALSVGYSGDNYLMQLQAPADYTALHFRNRMNGSWGSWKQIAFTDSNVASATKLQTARTIWGQSFDGTGDIGGNCIITGTLTTNQSWSDGASIHIRENRNDGAGGYQAIRFYYNNENQGTIHFFYNKYAGYEWTQRNINIGAEHITLGDWDNPVMLVDNVTRNVGIGMTNPGNKLDVNGKMAAYGIMSNGYDMVGAYPHITLHIQGVNYQQFFMRGDGVVELRYGDSSQTGARGTLAVGNFFSEGRGYFNAITIGSAKVDYPFMVEGDGWFNGWVRTVGNAGWYSESYYGGICMTDYELIRTYGGKIFYIEDHAGSTASSNLYGLGGHQLHLLIGGASSPHASILIRNSSSAWGICANNNGNMYIGHRPHTLHNNTYGDYYTLILSGQNMTCNGGITMYSDQRKKTILNHVELSLKQIANAPLIEHYYNSDDAKTTHVGSIAQYWAGMNDWFCKLDSEGFYTMEIQNCALASAISIARELDRYESKTDKTIKQLKKRICQLEEEVERLKSA